MSFSLQFSEPRKTFSDAPIFQPPTSCHCLRRSTAWSINLPHVAKANRSGSLSYLQRQSWAHPGGHTGAAIAMGSAPQVYQPQATAAGATAALL